MHPEWLSLRPTEQDSFNLTQDLVDVEPFHRGNGTIATWKSTNMKTFVKLLRTVNARDIRSVVRIFCETMQLIHPNIEVLCGVYMSSEVGIVSPFQEHSNILAFLGTQPSQRNIPYLKLKLLHDAACGLEYLFQQGITHGGLRAANVLVTVDQRAILTFPTTHWQDDVDGERSTASRSMSGHANTELRWLSPEHFQPNDSTHPARDGSTRRLTSPTSEVWSFGSLCIEVFTGKAPYPECRTQMEVVIKILTGKPPQKPSQIDEDFWRFCLACWQSDPSRRPRIGVLITQLKDLMDTYGSTELAPSLNITAEISGIPHAPDRFTDYADIYCGRRTGPHGEEQVTLRFPRIGEAGQLSQAEYLRALRREISIWSTVKHDNILPLFGVYLPATRPPALVYPWCSFGNVKESLRLELANPSLLGLKLLILDEIFQAVNYLHQHAPKIIHGHLKGDNVMISSNRTALLCDFSFAEMLDTGPRGTAPSASSAIVTGSYRWMAPELLEEHSQRSLATDIWACGCLILEILSLSIPYEDHGDAQVIRVLGKELPSRPSGIPDELWELAATCWQVDPELRPRIATVLDGIRGARVAYPATHLDFHPHTILNPDDANFKRDRALFAGEDITTRVSNVSPHVSTSGGYSDIYQADLATHTGSVKVAVKVIVANYSLTIMKKEIAVWCKLQHPNILRLYGISWNHGQRKLPGMVSPWCSNGDVLNYLRKYQGDPQLGSIKHKMRRRRQSPTPKDVIEPPVFNLIVFVRLLG